MNRALPILLSIILLGSVSCKHEPGKVIVPETKIEDNYPEAVGKIITTKCATAGCHNAVSYQASGGGLLLDTWEHLFDGGNTGAALVAYSPENSPLLYFINAYDEFGPIPTDNMKMPLNRPSLSKEEYLVLRNWVVNGCPDKNGTIPFASNADTRQKIYLVHQGCDYVTVIDAEKKVTMRCIPTGKNVTIESAYSVKIAPDGHAYISFWANEYIFRFDTKTDSVIDEINTGFPNSNILFVPNNDNDILVTNIFTSSLVRINTASKEVTKLYGNGSFSAPHGIAVNKTFDTFFVTEQSGNIIHKIAEGGTIKKITIDGLPPTTANGLNPYNIIMAPDQSKYFVTCAGSNEVRVMDAYADTLIKSIAVGKTPTEMAISTSKPYLFVSCTDDEATIPIYRGSVYIIDYNNYQVVKKINDRYNMPHALTVDEKYGRLFVFNRNKDPNGPVPHHNSATCNGRNGYYSVYDFKLLQPVDNKRYEVTVDPFAADVRFK